MSFAILYETVNLAHGAGKGESLKSPSDFRGSHKVDAMSCLMCQFLIYDTENSAFGRDRGRLLSVTCGNKINYIVYKQNQPCALYLKLKGNFQWIEKAYES